MKRLAAVRTGLLLAASLAFASLTVAPDASAAAYTVKPGDSLWSIAAAHRISVEELQAANALATATIYPGQTLTVPGSGSYAVRSGDTLYQLSNSFGVPLRVLVNANPHIRDPNLIWPGMIIAVPATPDRFAYGAFPLERGTYDPFINNYADARTWTPDGSGNRSHEGVDIFAEEGTPVYAAVGGTVMNVGWNVYGGYRLTVKSFDGSTAFYYAHLSRYGQPFSIGETVRQGQRIGYAGSTGYGPEGTSGRFLSHLHFGMYAITDSGLVSFDPYPYLVYWEANRS